MAFDEGLAERVRECTEHEFGVSEKKMFGGLCFLVNGNMYCGVLKSELMVRVGPAAYEEALSGAVGPGARKMDFTGRPMKGMVFIGEEGVIEDEHLSTWVAKGFTFARALPPKAKKTK